jgi:hypothetical protein
VRGQYEPDLLAIDPAIGAVRVTLRYRVGDPPPAVGQQTEVVRARLPVEVMDQLADLNPEQLQEDRRLAASTSTHHGHFTPTLIMRVIRKCDRNTVP